MPKVTQVCNQLSPSQGGENVRKLLAATQADLAALRASVVAITAKLDVLTAKLNADTGVADTNYATNFAASCDPAALTLEA